MYSLKEAWLKMNGSLPYPGWDGKLYCNRTDAHLSYRANITQGFMTAYTFTLVKEGWLKLIYSGRELSLGKNDLYFYSPGLSVNILSASDDYKGICLLADEQMTLDSSLIKNPAQITYHSVVQFNEPKLTLPVETASMIDRRMEEIRNYLHSDNANKDEIIRHLYAIFLLELSNAQQKGIPYNQVPKRIEELFIRFIELLPENCAAHHSLDFYASQMDITTTYLSRIVRLVSGRTAADYINQFIVREATFLLRTSPLSIGQIADSLHFSDIASFSRFFSRMTGLSPIKYRALP